MNTIHGLYLRYSRWNNINDTFTDIEYNVTLMPDNHVICTEEGISIDHIRSKFQMQIKPSCIRPIYNNGKGFIYIYNRDIIKEQAKLTNSEMLGEIYKMDPQFTWREYKDTLDLIKYFKSKLDVKYFRFLDSVSKLFLSHEGQLSITYENNDIHVIDNCSQELYMQMVAYLYNGVNTSETYYNLTGIIEYDTYSTTLTF